MTDIDTSGYESEPVVIVLPVRCSECDRALAAYFWGDEITVEPCTCRATEESEDSESE